MDSSTRMKKEVTSSLGKQKKQVEALNLFHMSLSEQHVIHPKKQMQN
jgi:hypothetical protein